MQPAIAFEDAMSGIRKVVDFDTPTGLKEMEASILRMANRMPIAATGIAEIVAAFGQGGVPTQELLGYAKAAAKVAIAFKIPADAAGNAMQHLRSAFGATLPELVQVTDTMNALGNSMASDEKDILSAMERLGSLGKVARVSMGDVAAFTSVMLSAGNAPEAVGTAVKDMITDLTAGKAATKGQKEAFATLGLNAERVALRTRNAGGTVRALMTKLGKLRPDQQIATASQLFGKEHVGKLLSLANLEELDKALRTARDTSKSAGSVHREFGVQMETTSAATKTLGNRIEELRIRFGQGLTPGIRQATEALGPHLEALSAWMAKNPKLVSEIALTTGAVLGLTTAVLVGSYAWAGMGVAAAGGATAALGAARLARGGVGVLDRAAVATATGMGTVARGIGAVGAAAAGAVLHPVRTVKGAVAGMAGAASAAAQAVGRGASAATQAVGRAAGNAAGYALLATHSLGTAVRSPITSAKAAIMGLVRVSGIGRIAMLAFRTAIVGTGIGALALGIAAGGTWIYNNWSNLKAMAEGFGEGFMAALGPAGPLVKDVGDALGGLIGWFTNLTGPMEGAEGSFRSFGVTAGKAVGEAANAVAGFVSGMY
ncbi:MAG: phage tail tape measure protein, partial [Paracraurococcus sp.]